jgi:hypothetical protein
LRALRSDSARAAARYWIRPRSSGVRPGSGENRVAGHARVEGCFVHATGPARSVVKALACGRAACELQARFGDSSSRAVAMCRSAISRGASRGRLASWSMSVVANAANRGQTSGALVACRLACALTFGLAEELLGVGLGEVVAQVWVHRVGGGGSGVWPAPGQVAVPRVGWRTGPDTGAGMVRGFVRA